MEDSDFYMAELGRLMADYRKQPEDIAGLLEKVVELFGFLPGEVIHKIAQELSLPIEELFDLAEANGLLSASQRGKHVISVCCGTSCFTKGSNEILNVLSTELGLSPGETTPNNKFSLQIVRCLGACGLGPNMMIDEDVFAHIKPEKIPEILAKYL